MTEREIDWMALANRKPKGKRPSFFDEPEDDVFYSVLLALVGEVSVMRHRLDTVERLLERKGTITRADIEAFVPDTVDAAERSDMTREYILRIMRGPMQAVEAMAENEPPVEQVCEELLNS
ncbi:hypothetical protein ACUJ46_07635 [Sandaracinobacteroides sp. A072]|uniref:hypothetical protein n=1 Tax=Sandaracinobacteroides sp. A072 TaxID=3461146 RepID=UPI0040433E1C